MRISDWSSDVCPSDLVLDFYRIYARLQDNEPRRCFAPLLGRDSDDRSFCDTRILDQLTFKIDGVYVEPSRNDHIFCPADQFDETILIDPADIPRPQPCRTIPRIDPIVLARRSEERRVGKECVSKCR